jgi:hypothetical protein
MQNSMEWNVLGLLLQKTWLQVHYLQSITVTEDPAETQPAVRNHMAVETSLLAQASTRQHNPTDGSTLAPALLPKRRAVYKSQVAKQQRLPSLRSHGLPTQMQS